jgi:hypothetical protein
LCSATIALGIEFVAKMPISYINEAPSSVSISNQSISENLDVGTKVVILMGNDEGAHETLQPSIDAPEDVSTVGAKVLTAKRLILRCRFLLLWLWLLLIWVE